MSSKKNNIIDKLTKQPDVFKASAKIAESFKASQMIGSQLRPIPAYNELLGSLHAIQSQLLLPTYELQKSLAPIYELSDAVNSISRAFQINDTFKSINALSASITELQQRIQAIAAGIAEVWQDLQPVLEEIDQQIEQVELERNKLPAKINTISEKGISIEGVEKEIIRLEDIISTCDQSIGILNNCKCRYKEIDAADFEEDIEKIHELLNEIESSRENCEKLLDYKTVQLELFLQSDEEYARRKNQADDIQAYFPIFFPDYIQEFLKMEEELITNNYLDNNLVWIKDKQILAAFVEKLSECRYFRRSTTASKIHRKQITEQFKPSKLQKFPLPESFPITIIPK